MPVGRYCKRCHPNHRSLASLVHHSDRGIQYACGDYIARLEAAGIQPSMSRAGCPYDNAMAESFMKTLKHEEVDASDLQEVVLDGRCDPLQAWT